MICRCCGHDNNGRDKGKCDNCGYELSTQNDSLKTKRSALQSKLEKPVHFQERTEFKIPPSKGHSTTIGILIAIVGMVGAFVITNVFERSELTPELPERKRFEEIVEETYVDPIATLIASDIVYVLNDSASRALPRANVNMTLIPEGSTVSFLGSWTVPLRPAATFVVQKISQREFKPLKIDRLCVWTDTTKTEFISTPLIRVEESSVDTISAPPVLVKLYFTPEMMRGSIEEFSIQYDVAVTTPELSDNQLNDLILTVSRRLERKDYEERSIQVATLFDYDAYNLGDAVDIMRRIAPMAIDSLGYEGFSLSVFTLTN
ncbi:MAG: hypothetical protein GQ565_08150 [Candidatus Aegiribacteria sp.]|nr:hypothetical protein [Candidatus Aegiribacteria sp.]